MLASALRRRVLSPLGARLLGGRWIHAGRVSSSASASPDAAASADDEDPAGKLASDLATYARQKYRSGDRDAAAGVLEHGADMVMRVGSGPAVDAAASRARLAWALMQAVRTFPGISPRSTRPRKSNNPSWMLPTNSPPAIPAHDTSPHTQDAGELAHAQDTLTDACTSADASGASMDRVASHVAAALNAARALAAGPSTSSSLPDAERVMDVHLDAADTAASEAGPETDPHAVVMRIAALGARGAAAMAAGDANAANAASREIFERTLGPSDESNDDTSPGLEFSRTYPLSPEAVNAAVVAASDKPHGAAVAHAIKQCAQWSALNDESDLYVDIVRADALYAFAESAADAARESEHVSAAASAMYADATYADVKLGRAQLALRTAVRLAGDMREIQSGEDSGESESSEFVAEAVEEMGKRVREALATAESSAAAALTACEALGGETQKDPRVVSLFFTLVRAIRLKSCFV
jgi:hypothetical protein